MVDVTRPGGPDDIKALLRAIKSNLEYQGASIGVLISEVRDSMTGRGANTVRDAIHAEFASLHRDITMIHDALRGGGMGGGPTTHGAGAGLAGPDRVFQNAELQILERIARRVEELESELAVLQGRGGGGAGGMGGAFNINTIHSRFRHLDEMLRSATYQQADFLEKSRQLTEYVFKSGGSLQQEYTNRQKQAIFNLTNLAARTFDLINIFERLGSFIKTQIVDRYSTMFQRDRSLGLTGAQIFADDFERYFKHGLENMGPSYKLTEEAIKKNVEGGGGSSMLVFGQNLAQMSQRFEQLQKGMEARGTSPLQTFSPQELMQFMQDQAKSMRQMGTFASMRPDQQLDVMNKGLLYWADIAKYTGVSASKLETMAKKAEDELNELQAMGNVSAQERVELRKNLVTLETVLGPDMKKMLVDYFRAGREPGLFFGYNKDAAIVQQLSGGTYLRQLQQIAAELVKPQGDRREFIAALAGFANQIKTPQGGPATSAIGLEHTGVARIFGNIQAAKGLDEETIRKMTVQDTNDALRRFSATIDEARAKAPQLMGIAGMVAGGIGDILKFTAQLGIASFVLKNFWQAGAAANLAGGGGMAAAAGGGLSMLGRVAGVAGRATPVLGAIGGAGAAYMEGSSGAGVVGAGLGGGGGAWAGAALGTAMAGPVGTIVGGILGGVLGSYLGRKAGETVSPASVAPAVPTQSNAFGPAAAEVAAATASTYQDSSLSLLTQIVQSGAQGNYILGQMYGELARQTGYLRGDPNGAGGGVAYNGQGLNTTVAPAVSGTRADAGNPYVGPSA